jgi:hypothetical protein
MLEIKKVYLKERGHFSGCGQILVLKEMLHELAGGFPGRI